MSVPWYLMAKGKGGGGYKTASGPIVSISDAVAAPLRSLLVAIDPVQDLHGYDNPWPAGGGTNKFNEQLTTGILNSDGTVSASSSRLVSDFIPVVPGETYAFVWPSNYGRGRGAFYDANKDLVQYEIDFPPSIIETNVSIFTVPNGAYYLRFNLTSSYGTTYNHDISINYPSTDHSYHSYSNICPISGWSAVNVWVKPTYDPTADPTATIQLGQTVYGATLDVTNGVLTVDRAMVDLGTLEYSSGFSGFYTLGIKDDIKVPTTVAQSGLKSDIFIVGNTSNADNMYIQITGAYVGWVVFLPSATYATAADFKTAMNGHQLVYELATPITIPLTDITVETLAGQNVMWGDCGDVTVEYLSAGGANPDLMKLAVAFMGR